MPEKMPQVNRCSVTDCAYNHDGACRTMAITVGGGESPECDTYFVGSRKGGAMAMTASVGACKVERCRFNESYECAARQGIQVDWRKDCAMCSTYQQR